MSGSGDDVNFPSKPSVVEVNIDAAGAGFIDTVGDDTSVAGFNVGVVGLNTGAGFGAVVVVTGRGRGALGTGANVVVVGRINTGVVVVVGGRDCTVCWKRRDANVRSTAIFNAPSPSRYTMRRILRILNFELPTTRQCKDCNSGGTGQQQRTRRQSCHNGTASWIRV